MKTARTEQVTLLRIIDGDTVEVQRPRRVPFHRRQRAHPALRHRRSGEFPERWRRRHQVPGQDDRNANQDLVGSSGHRPVRPYRRRHFQQAGRPPQELQLRDGQRRSCPLLHGRPGRPGSIHRSRDPRQEQTQRPLASTKHPSLQGLPSPGGTGPEAKRQVQALRVRRNWRGGGHRPLPLQVRPRPRLSPDLGADTFGEQTAPRQNTPAVGPTPRRNTQPLSTAGPDETQHRRAGRPAPSAICVAVGIGDSLPICFRLLGGVGVLYSRCTGLPSRRSV